MQQRIVECVEEIVFLGSFIQVLYIGPNPALQRFPLENIPHKCFSSISLIGMNIKQYHVKRLEILQSRCWVRIQMPAKLCFP